MNEREKRVNGKRKTAGWKGFNMGLPMPSLLTSRALGSASLRKNKLKYCQFLFL